MNKKVGLLFFVVCLLANSAYAKRGPKPEVKPLHKGEYIYEEGSEGYYFDVDKSIFPEGYDFGVILVKSTKEPKYVFRVPVYAVKISSEIETDGQWVEIESMEFKNDEVITIVNEKDQVFEFNINTYEVTEVTKKNSLNAIELLEKKYQERIDSISEVKYSGPQPEKAKLEKVDDVVSLAEKYLFRYFGEEKIRNQQPYTIMRYKNKWFVRGYVPTSNYDDGIFQIIINADDSQIETIVHGKW